MMKFQVIFQVLVSQSLDVTYLHLIGCARTSVLEYSHSSRSPSDCVGVKSVRILLVILIVHI
jgi:hypothetical protein